MKTHRPKIQIPLAPIDKTLIALTVLGIICMFVFTFTSYPNLSETIPTHFNAKGEADAYGKTINIWILPFVSLLITTLLFIINRFPHIHNYMVNITEENALKNYRLSTRTVRVINFFVMLLLLYIQYVMLQAGMGKETSLGVWLLPIVISSSIILPIVLIIQLIRINK
ncbi:DUF1648 domain-containing protein [Xanthomarina sp. GH4-25]|uniref:DUF1648 domain-containing protein n=1 Tax=Xanthomarina sp. GH4-25 TaxID=3349335 RepID=UPI003877B9FD